MRLPVILTAMASAQLILTLAACSGNDADLETPEYAITTISVDGPATARITRGDRIEVQGLATNHDRFQHDVYFTATLTDASGRVVATATGKLEDWPAGHSGLYTLVGKTTSPTWAHVRVVVSNVTEHVRGRPE